METQARIQVAVLKLRDREYPLYKGMNVIGRNKAATVNIVNLNVSQNHAVIIEVDETQHYISDMNSSNGTYLYGTKLKPFHLYDLNDDSHIIIGNVDATYYKLSQSVVVSTTSTQRLNNTQSMSQSMYACNTQLITDETISDNNTQNERQLHLRSIPPPPKFVAEHTYTNGRESQAVDIHEIATQVMTYPDRRSPLPPADMHLAATQLVEEQSAEIGIHDEATQVVDLPERNKNIFSSPQKEHPVENKASQNQENNSDPPVVDTVVSDEDSQATNIGSQSSVQLLMMKQPIFHKRYRYHDSQEPSTSTASNNQQKVVDDSFQEMNARSDSNVVVEESLDNISKASDDLLTDALEFPTGELETSLHEGENPGTEKLSGRQRLKFDSSQQDGMQKKSESDEYLSSDIASSKKPLKKLESDDSVDSNKVENDAEHTEDIIATKKKPVRKLDSTQESDSDTDIECSPVIGDTQRMKPVQKSLIVDSEDDSDIEKCNNVNHSVNNKPGASDSDTEIEEEDTNKVVLKVDDVAKKDIMKICKGKIKTTQVDSNEDKNANDLKDHSTDEKNKTDESDCARIEYSDKAEVAITNREPSGKTIGDSTDITGNIVKKCQTAKSDSDTDIEDNNDEDIAATKVCKSAEDAAEKVDDVSHNNFEVEGNTSSKNVSVGFNESDCIPATQDAFALAFNYDQKNEKVSTDSSEESFKLGLTELMDGSQNSERLKKSDGGRSVEEPIREGSERRHVNALNRDKPEDDQLKDVHIIEQTIVAQKVVVNTEKIQNIDQVVEMKAQKIDVSEKKEEEDDDDDEAYIMPTQKLDIPSNSTESKQFKVPAKKFIFKRKALQLEQSITTMLSSQSDDMYMMPTQKLKEDGASQKGGGDEDDDNDEDVYIAATQVIEKNVPKEVDDNVYMLPTQKLTAAPSIDFASKNKDEDVVLNKFNLEVNHVEEKKDADHRPNECELAGYDTPTQVIESGGIRSVVSECGIGKSKDEHLFDAPTQVFDRPVDDGQSEFSGFQKPAEIERKSEEKSITLSQFENFAQTSAKSLEQVTAVIEEDRPESLSQIETFIKQPLNNVKQEEDLRKISHQKNSLSKSINSKLRSTRRVHHKESLDKTDHLTEVTVSEASTSYQKTISSSASDKIRKDMIKNIESSVSFSKENRNSGTRNKRKKSCDSETKETTTDIVNSSKLQIKERNDKRKIIDLPGMLATGSQDENKNEVMKPKSVDKSEKSAENTKSPTLKSACESNTNEKLLNVKDSDKTEIKSNTKSTRSKRTAEPCENLAASKSEDNAELDSVVSTSCKGKRKQYGNRDEEKSSKTKSTRLRSPGRHTAKEQPVAVQMATKAEIPSASSRPKRGKSSEKTTLPADGDGNIEEETKIASDIRTSKRMTRKNSESEQAKSSLDVKKSPSRGRRGSCESDETEPVLKPSSRKRTRTVADLEVIPETEATATAAAATAGNDNVKVSRNKRKNDSSISKISEKMPKMEDNDLEDFCVSTARTSKSKSSKTATAAVNVCCESAGSKLSTCTAPEKNVTSRSKRGGKAAASKNAASSAESADGGDSSTPSTPRKASTDLSESRSTPEKNKRRQKPRVVFTMLDSPQLESFIKHLGGSVVDSVDGCSILVTEHVKRSMKLLTAVGQAKPICSPAWIKASKNAREFLDPWDYILVDEVAESKWDFSLKESLERASRKKLFENYVFQVMTTNAADVLKGAIQSCGGKCIAKKPPGDAASAASASNFVVVATADQKSKFQRIRGQVPNVLVVEPEAIFDGVLRQEIRFSDHLLT